MGKPSLPLAGYPRVSRKGDRDELRSPDFQIKKMQGLAEAEGFEIEFTDPEIDVSGSKPRRAILDEIIRRVKTGELGGIVVAKLDRLSRLSPKDRVLLFEEIESAGGVVLSASEQLDPSTPEGRFAREVFLGIARMQWEKYREGFEEAKAGAIENGIPVNTRAAVGYRKRDGDGEDRRLEVDPSSAPVVRRVFELRAQGEGPTALGTYLEEAGVTTSQGSKSWSKQAVYNLIQNRVYLGELRYGRDDRYVNAKSHEPIVDLATWTAAQHPNGRQLAGTRSQKWEFVLVGLLRCATCRYCLQGTTTSHANRKRIYRCTRKHAGGICSAPVRVDADRVEDAAVAAFWAITENLEARGVVSLEDHSELEQALDRAERALEQWTSTEIQEAIGDLSEYAAGLRERRQAREAAAERLGRARASSPPPTPMPDVETLRGAWERMTVKDRRELLSLRFDCLALGRDPLTLTVYPSGTAPADLPRRGYKVGPTLEPFPPSSANASVTF
jgi:site-specific DNA recombinase